MAKRSLTFNLPSLVKAVIPHYLGGLGLIRPPMFGMINEDSLHVGGIYN